MKITMWYTGVFGQVFFNRILFDDIQFIAVITTEEACI